MKHFRMCQCFVIFNSIGNLFDKHLVHNEVTEIKLFIGNTAFGEMHIKSSYFVM